MTLSPAGGSPLPRNHPVGQQEGIARRLLGGVEGGAHEGLVGQWREELAQRLGLREKIVRQLLHSLAGSALRALTLSETVSEPR